MEEHANHVPWEEVVRIILTTKDPKKRDGCFEIEDYNHYVLFRITDGILYVVNAKRKK